MSGLPSRSRRAAKAGGARRDRTDDLLLAKQALSQLSYGPCWVSASLKLVGLGRLERPTSPLSGVRSNHLSYRPLAAMGPKLKPRRAPWPRARLFRRKRDEDGEI